MVTTIILLAISGINLCVLFGVLNEIQGIRRTIRLFCQIVERWDFDEEYIEEGEQNEDKQD